MKAGRKQVRLVVHRNGFRAVWLFRDQREYRKWLNKQFLIDRKLTPIPGWFFY